MHYPEAPKVTAREEKLRKKFVGQPLGVTPNAG